MHCPITKEPFTDPVATEDGHCYERSAILSWLENNNISPFTGKKLGSKKLIPIHILRNNNMSDIISFQKLESEKIRLISTLLGYTYNLLLIYQIFLLFLNDPYKAASLLFFKAIIKFIMSESQDRIEMVLKILEEMVLFTLLLVNYVIFIAK